MAPRRPTLGFRTTTDAVLALMARGVSRERIADTLALPPGRVTEIASRAAGRSRWGRPADRAVPMVLPPALVHQLKPHAEARGIRPEDVVLKLLAEALEARLVPAILDDGVDA